MMTHNTYCDNTHETISKNNVLVVYKSTIYWYKRSTIVYVVYVYMYISNSICSIVYAYIYIYINEIMVSEEELPWKTHW